MNDFKFSDLYIGMKAEFTVNITESMIDDFTRLTGDINPLHTDNEFAASKGYPKRVAYGMLTASFYSTLAGVYIPGKNCLLMEVDANFTSPVYAGDTLTISGEIIALDSRVNSLRIKARVKNQNGKTVSRANILGGVLDEE